jgi:hypothetical protein
MSVLRGVLQLELPCCMSAKVLQQCSAEHSADFTSSFSQPAKHMRQQRLTSSASVLIYTSSHAHAYILTCMYSEHLYACIYIFIHTQVGRRSCSRQETRQCQLQHIEQKYDTELELHIWGTEQYT